MLKIPYLPIYVPLPCAPPGTLCEGVRLWLLFARTQLYRSHACKSACTYMCIHRVFSCYVQYVRTHRNSHGALIHVHWRRALQCTFVQCMAQLVSLIRCVQHVGIAWCVWTMQPLLCMCVCIWLLNFHSRHSGWSFHVIYWPTILGVVWYLWWCQQWCSANVCVCVHTLSYACAALTFTG